MSEDLRKIDIQDEIAQRRGGDKKMPDDMPRWMAKSIILIDKFSKWTGNIVALPNNRVRVTNPAWFVTGDGAPDFRPSQWVHHSKQDPNYVADNARVFDNLYNDKGES